MKHRFLAGAIVALALSSPAVAAGPADVTVRVEGAEQTLIPQTAVTTTTAPVNKSGKEGESCTGTSAAGALEIATRGDWSGSYFGGGFGYTVERILAETHAFPDPSYFSVWLNNRESQVGVCGIELQTGDELLIFVGRCDYSAEEERCTNPPVLPLGIDAPDRAAPGTAVNVKVVEYDTEGNPTPVAGATVSGGDAAATTDAAGVAAVTFTSRGEQSVRATKANRAPSELEPVCVSDGADGFCGTTKPGDPAPPATAAPPPPDRQHPWTTIAAPSEGQRFTRAQAPREIRWIVAPDPSGIHAVKLRLTRRHRGRCWYLSRKADDLVRTRCGRAFFLAVGDRAEQSYLLPERLRSGRYVLDVVSIDKAFNREPLARGRSRVVFTVR